ncbi:hypothetical protein NDU88_003889 [Pleurodeles waltl]|uniref:Uncharacterized protein n=1 Tax=Pleurodeles waltl TaxID=8319 RepID=A0AAV7LJQ9_PLEWA|nr:hypothetical protein NDU88_003889 [Pleurodeles waltl]
MVCFFRSFFTVNLFLKEMGHELLSGCDEDRRDRNVLLNKNLIRNPGLRVRSFDVNRIVTALLGFILACRISELLSGCDEDRRDRNVLLNKNLLRNPGPRVRSFDVNRIVTALLGFILACLRLPANTH